MLNRLLNKLKPQANSSTAHHESKSSKHGKKKKEETRSGRHSEHKTHKKKFNGEKSEERSGENAGKRRRNSTRSKQSPKKNQPTWSIEDFQVTEIEGRTRFHDFGLPDTLMRGIQEVGFEYCSPIQEQVLPQTLQGRDAIGKAQTGTGKTAAFLITLIDDLLLNPLEEKRYLGEPRAIIIAPTRELVMQIADDALGLCKYTGLNVVSLYGGMDYGKQKKQLEKDFIDIVVATPGRLIDFMMRKDIYLDRVESLVLDEADRMLDMGFIPQVKRIIRATPHKEHRQTLFFSATFTHDIINLSTQWTQDPVHVEIEPEHVATDTVEQKVYLVSSEEKFRTLITILKQSEVTRVILFANRRDQVQHLYHRIRKAGIKAGVLSGEITQKKRAATLEAFKNNQLDVLVATDVMGRGIHVDGVSHVINYNLPDNPDDYVHRIGRTGRAGSSGVAISLACEFESFQLPELEEHLGKKLICEQPNF